MGARPGRIGLLQHGLGTVVDLDGLVPAQPAQPGVVSIEHDRVAADGAEHEVGAWAGERTAVGTGAVERGVRAVGAVDEPQPAVSGADPVGEPTVDRRDLAERAVPGEPLRRELGDVDEVRRLARRDQCAAWIVADHDALDRRRDGARHPVDHDDVTAHPVVDEHVLPEIDDVVGVAGDTDLDGDTRA